MTASRERSAAIPIALALAVAAGLSGRAASNPAPAVRPAIPDAARISWPDGTDTCSFENVEGIVLVPARCSSGGGADSSGSFVLDTGAGFLALDGGLAHRLGLQDSAAAGPIRFASRALAHLEFGSWTRDQVQPVLIFDADVARRVTDRPVLGLLGQQLVADRAVWIDYRDERLALVPASRAHDPANDVAESRTALTAALGPHAAPIRFRLAGDGKVVVRARVSRSATARALTLIVDTGSTKTVLFADSLKLAAPESRSWKAVAGVSAPTLFGDAGARMARVPWMRLEDARDARDTHPEAAARSTADAPASDSAAELRDMDAALIDGELQRVLEADLGEPVHGLLGYSFLRHFHVALDYPRRVMWLDPLADDVDERPYEYSHVGVQLERRGDDMVVAGVLDGSPAARAGIRVDDVLVSLDGAGVRQRDLTDTARALEGPPGSHVTLTVRRDGVERTYRLTRKKLL
jgi:hypothetical protein